MENVSDKELGKLLMNLKETLGDEQTSTSTETLIALLSLPDEQFSVLAPSVMQNYQKTLNNPDDKLALFYSMNASGGKSEDLTDSFMELADLVEEMSLPRIKRDFVKELLATICNAINDVEGIAKRVVQIPIELCHKDAIVPQYAHLTDSGADVFALEDFTVAPGEIKLIPTGIKVALPVGFELQVRQKSGRTLKSKLRIANTPGTIDQGYRDEIKIIVENTEPRIKDLTIDDEGKVTSIEYGRDFTVGKGEKFCQLVLSEVPRAAFYYVSAVNQIGEDRHGGFGSTSIYQESDPRYKTDVMIAKE